MSGCVSEGVSGCVSEGVSDFFESSNDDEDIDVVYSQYTPYRIAIS